MHCSAKTSYRIVSLLALLRECAALEEQLLLPCPLQRFHDCEGKTINFEGVHGI